VLSSMRRQRSRSIAVHATSNDGTSAGVKEASVLKNRGKKKGSTYFDTVSSDAVKRIANALPDDLVSKEDPLFDNSKGKETKKQ
jgi:hypothetical protein